MVRPFWNYYGGKWRAAPRYPAPAHDTIVEPFAGAAGYSLRYHARRVVLVERYAVIAEVWRYLIAVRSAEVRAIPAVDRVDDLPSWVPQGARDLVGFNLNSGTASPRRRLSSGLARLRTLGRKLAGWSAERRDMIASQVDHIRHWRVIEGDYSEAPDMAATWFIDPPYQLAGSHYVHGPAGIDFAHLAEWCRSRRGQTVVCEAQGATWIPFTPFERAKSWGGGSSATSAEAVWTAVAA